jgi:hypothetical protein
MSTLLSPEKRSDPRRTLTRIRRLTSTLRHAFAVEPSGPAEPTPDEHAALDPLLAEIRRRGLVAPAVIFLESCAPLNTVGAQALHFMQPFATAVLDPVRYATLSRYLERRGSIEWVVRELQRSREEASK